MFCLLPSLLQQFPTHVDPQCGWPALFKSTKPTYNRFGSGHSPCSSELSLICNPLKSLLMCPCPSTWYPGSPDVSHMGHTWTQWLNLVVFLRSHSWLLGNVLGADHHKTRINDLFQTFFDRVTACAYGLGLMTNHQHVDYLWLWNIYDHDCLLVQ